jgi:hypothetical protein
MIYDLPTLSVGGLHIYLPRSRAPKVSRIYDRYIHIR